MSQGDVVFVDTLRLAHYERAVRGASSRPPMWRQSDGLAESAAPVDAGTLERLAQALEERGWLSREPVTSEDRWLADPTHNECPPFRCEIVAGRRVALRSADDAAGCFWWIEDRHRVLCLWEEHPSTDARVNLSRDHSLADLFAQFHMREFEDRAFWKQIAIEGLGDDPTGLFKRFGEVDPPCEVAILYRLHDVCFPVTRRPPVVASFGAPIAIWRAVRELGEVLSAFLETRRWSEVSACLMTHTDLLFHAQASEQLALLADTAPASAARHQIEERAALLAAAEDTPTRRATVGGSCWTRRWSASSSKRSQTRGDSRI
jgi:hypothetical protein